jgi:hypothetical protein
MMDSGIGFFVRRRRARILLVLAAPVAAALSLASGPARAGIYDPGALSFQTTGQSMWDTGSSTNISNSVFVGTTWSASTGTFGGIAGSESTRVPGTGGTLTATNPLWSAWNECKKSIFSKICGGQPARYISVSNPIPAQYVDTRSGATLSASTSGKVGFDVGYSFDSGTVNADVGYDTHLSLPDTVTPGEYFYLNPSSILAGQQQLTTSFPQASAKIDAVFQAGVNFDATGCVALAGCTSGQGGVNIDETFEVVSFNDPTSSPGQIKILGEADPALFQFGSPIEIGGPLTNVGNVTVHVPELETTGSLDTSANKIVSGGETNFIDLRADMDGLALLAVGLPTILGASLDIGPVSISYDVVDVEAGPDIKIVQQFELDPTLMVDLQFDDFVDIQGVGSTQSYSGSWDSLPGIALLPGDTNVAVTPTFYVDTQLSNQTGFGVSGVFTTQALSASATASLGPLSVDLASFDPVVDFTAETATLALPPIIDNTFSLGGFNRATGHTFTIGTGGSGLATIASKDFAAELTTGSPVSISQLVDNPGNLFTLEFDYLFQTGGGFLDVFLGGYSLLGTPIEGPGAPQSDFAHFSEIIDLIALGIDLIDPVSALEFLFTDDSAGSILLIDNISFPGLLNGGFQTGDVANWRTSQTGTVATLVTATSVPAPGTLLMFVIGLAAVWTLRRRPQAAGRRSLGTA